MILRRFLPPNFRCRIRDGEGDGETVWLMRAESRDEVRRLLESRGHQVLEILDYDFQDWLDRASAETSKAVAAGGSRNYEFRSDIWSELKQYLFEVFGRKCAYCEARVRHVSFGDVEHYRPKRPIAEDPQHPGYYWLAYDATNLLPSCEPCNRSRKRNRFPAYGNFWARRPEDLDREQPLLLHPYREEHDPRKHLEFQPVDPDIGVSIVRGRTEEGKASIDVYGLNRADLIEHRGEMVLNAMKDWAQAVLGGEAARQRFWSRLHSGEVEYALARFEQIEWKVEQERQELAGNKPLRAAAGR